jgi:hypothetical protein
MSRMLEPNVRILETRSPLDTFSRSPHIWEGSWRTCLNVSISQIFRSQKPRGSILVHRRTTDPGVGLSGAGVKCVRNRLPAFNSSRTDAACSNKKEGCTWVFVSEETRCFGRFGLHKSDLMLISDVSRYHNMSRLHPG